MGNVIFKFRQLVCLVGQPNLRTLTKYTCIDMYIYIYVYSY